MSLRYEFEPLHFDRKFNCVADAAVDSKGRIFVMTDKTPAMTVLDANGQFLYDWPAEAIVGAHGVFIDKDDFVYCADSGNHTVSKFTTEGERIFQLGNPGIPSDSGCINGNFKTIKRGAGPFNVPSKVTVSDEGEIFFNRWLWKFQNTPLFTGRSIGPFLGRTGRRPRPAAYSPWHRCFCRRQGLCGRQREQQSADLFRGWQTGGYLGEHLSSGWPVRTGRQGLCGGTGLSHLY